MNAAHTTTTWNEVVPGPALGPAPTFPAAVVRLVCGARVRGGEDEPFNLCGRQ
jgi:hypothetical protein